MVGITGNAGAGLKIFVLVLLVLVLFFGSIVWFDYLGIVNARDQLSMLYSFISREKVEVVEDVDDIFLLDKERYEKLNEALDLREEQLDRRENELAAAEREMEQKLEIIEEMESALAERENSFNMRIRMYENRISNLEQSARYLVGMPPERARDILLEMNDQDVIDVMRVTERLAREEGDVSLVAYWLSLMPAERSASIKRKMTLKPDETGVVTTN